MSVIVKSEYNGRQFDSSEGAVDALRKQNQERILALSSLDVPMAKVSVYLDRWVQTNFKTEGGLTGPGGWKDFKFGGRILPDGLIDTTAKLLQLTGRLRASFSPFYTKRSAGIGSDLDYSEDHHKGIGTAKRPLLPDSTQVSKDITRILNNHVADSINLKSRARNNRL